MAATTEQNVERSNQIASDFISSDSLANEQQPNNDAQSQAGILSRVAGGAYGATASVLSGAVGGAKYVATPVVGGASWITGAAWTTSFGVAKSVGSYVLPARFRPAIEKDKCE